MFFSLFVRINFVCDNSRSLGAVGCRCQCNWVPGKKWLCVMSDVKLD